MTKKTMTRKSKVFTWTILLLAPIFVWILSYYSGNSVTINEILTQTGITNSAITDVLNSIFAIGGGMLEIVEESSFCVLYGAYITAIVLLRVIINVLCFIPVVIGNLTAKWSRSDEENLL